MEIKVLVADDDPVFRQLICDIVKKEGLTPLEACHGSEALDVFFANLDIDLVILDVMMPQLDGWEVLKEVRSQSDVPVIMLTALGDEKNEVKGLQKGADDYIAKPFSYEVFVARLQALLRKVRKDRSAALKVGDITILQDAQKVLVGAAEADLNRKEYTLLVFLVKNQNLVLHREAILNAVWGYDYDGDARTIDTHIKTLRAKLGPCGTYIKTVRGSGYQFEVDMP